MIHKKEGVGKRKGVGENSGERGRWEGGRKKGRKIGR